jgi:hypothetical protein
MTYSLRRSNDVFYLILGSVCLVFGLVGAFGGMFSSIGFAYSAIILVVIPIAVALAGNRTGHAIFPIFMGLGCGVAAAYILSIYVRDYMAGMTPTSFIHERSGWIVCGLNSAQIVLSIIKLKNLSRGHGATPWPQ